MPEEKSPRLTKPKSEQERLEHETRVALLVNDLRKIFRKEPSEDLMQQANKRRIALTADQPAKKAVLAVSLVALFMVITKPLYEWLRRKTAKEK